MTNEIPGNAQKEWEDVLACACQLYDAECALHAARMSGVAAWTDAASEKLHVAVANYLASLQTSTGGAKA